MKVIYFLRTMSLLLVAAIIFLGSGVISLHDHRHNHAVTHTLENEADSCHRSIYHGELTLGCKHKSHVHNAEIDCQLCDVINSRCDQDFVRTESLLTSSFIIENSNSVIQSHTYSQKYDHGKRGPPQV